jgi:hypothetical protein
VKFVLDTEDYCLELNPVFENEEWDLVSYSFSDWAQDPKNRISVTGFIIYLLGAPICWRSKGQNGVTLSSSESEYVAMSVAVKEIRFIYFLLKGDVTKLVWFSWLRTQVQELEHVILIPDIILFMKHQRWID